MSAALSAANFTPAALTPVVFPQGPKELDFNLLAFSEHGGHRQKGDGQPFS